MLETIRFEDFPGSFVLSCFVSYGWCVVSMEMYLETGSTASSYLFYVDGGIGKDPNSRQLEKTKCYSSKLVLSV